jgi:hypothetical protein
MADRCTSDEFIGEMAGKFSLHKKDETAAANKMIEECMPTIALRYAATRIAEQEQLKAQQDGKSVDHDGGPEAKHMVKAMMMAPQVMDEAEIELRQKIADKQKENKAKPGG